MAHFAVVTVDIDHLDADGLAEDLFGEILASFVPKACPFSGASIPASRFLRCVFKVMRRLTRTSGEQLSGTRLVE